MIVKTPGSQMGSPEPAEEGGEEVGVRTMKIANDSFFENTSVRMRLVREIECLLHDNHQKGKMMIMITKTSGSQVDSPVVEGKRKEGGGKKMRDLHKDT